MGKLGIIVKNPVTWFAGVMIVLSLFQTLKGDNLKSVIYSDGSGYYAYLPAIFIFNDGTFEKTLKAERDYFGENVPQYYLYKDLNNRNYDKCFPGIAVLQLPFFGLACLFSWLLRQPITGYSDIFLFFFYLGSLFYSITGIFLFEKFIRTILLIEKRELKWLVPVMYVASPLLFYCFNSPSYSHQYSFFLFGVFTLQVLKLKEGITISRLFIFGLILGMILLIRPTNILILLMIPFIIGDYLSSISWIKLFFQRIVKNSLTVGFGLFLALSILFIVWKWETGGWIVWTYNGEGFDFLSPQLFSCLFSYRIGLFLQIPILILSFCGLSLLFYRNRFQAIIWCVYFSVNLWIFSSWWCWDFESPFGNRPYTEHLFFLLIPILFLVSKYRVVSIASLIFLTIIGGIRYYEITTGYMTNQRFTKENYFESLQFWKKENKGRWNFTRACSPFGKKINEIVVLDEVIAKDIKDTDEFIYTVEVPLIKPRTNERYSYRVELEKKINDIKLEGVYLVIDAYSNDNSKRFYRSIDLYNDKFEGKNNWVNLIFEDQILDNFQEYDFVKIYIWNQAKKKFSIRNCKIILEEYKS